MNEQLHSDLARVTEPARLRCRIDPSRDSRVHHGNRTKAAITIRTLDAINRTRSLSDAESDRLYQAIRDERRHARQLGAKA